MSATPRPWRWVSVDGGWDGIAGPGGEIIARLSYNNPDNADLIVRAVNAHDDLLLAAKEAAVVIAEFAKAAGADPMKGTALPRLLAAIKKAEGI